MAKYSGHRHINHGYLGYNTASWDVVTPGADISATSGISTVWQPVGEFKGSNLLELPSHELFKLDVKYRDSIRRRNAEDAVRRHIDDMQQMRTARAQATRLGISAATQKRRELQDREEAVKHMAESSCSTLRTSRAEIESKMQRARADPEHYRISRGLTRKQALAVGSRNNYESKRAVVMDFDDCTGGLSDADALDVGKRNNYNTRKPVVMTFDNCTGGLSEAEARSIGQQNNYNSKPPVAMSF